jgi:hypothetical protein
MFLSGISNLCFRSVNRAFCSLAYVGSLGLLSLFALFCEFRLSLSVWNQSRLMLCSKSNLGAPSSLFAISMGA